MMYFCAKHSRAWQPQTLGGRGALGVHYPPHPAHWRPLALAVLWQAVQVARWGHCALPMLEVACDMCEGEAEPHKEATP